MEVGLAATYGAFKGITYLRQPVKTIIKKPTYSLKSKVSIAHPVKSFTFGDVTIKAPKDLTYIAEYKGLIKRTAGTYAIQPRYAKLLGFTPKPSQIIKVSGQTYGGTAKNFFSLKGKILGEPI